MDQMIFGGWKDNFYASCANVCVSGKQLWGLPVSFCLPLWSQKVARLASCSVGCANICVRWQAICEACRWALLTFCGLHLPLVIKNGPRHRHYMWACERGNGTVITPGREVGDSLAHWVNWYDIILYCERKCEIFCKTCRGVLMKWAGGPWFWDEPIGCVFETGRWAMFWDGPMGHVLRWAGGLHFCGKYGGLCFWGKSVSVMLKTVIHLNCLSKCVGVLFMLRSI